jgi:hypothetical protein
LQFPAGRRIDGDRGHPRHRRRHRVLGPHRRIRHR